MYFTAIETLTRDDKITNINVSEFNGLIQQSITLQCTLTNHTNKSLNVTINQ